MRREISVLLSALAAGCSIVNAPDTDFLDDPPFIPPPPIDGGPDVADMRIPDDGPDIPDEGPDVADMFVPPPREDCEGSGDEDGDGFVNCADDDCFTNIDICCGTSPVTMRNYPFRDTGVVSDFWVPSPATAMAQPALGAVTAVTGGALLLRASAGTLPQCVPMDAGMTLTVELDMRSGVTPMGNSLGVTLTRARQAGADALPAELRVAVHDGRRLVVSQAGIVRQQSDEIDAGTARVVVTIELVPSVTPIGTAGLLANVTATGADLPPPDAPMYVEQLVQSETEGAMTRLCTLDGAVGAGLYVALEGGETDAAIGEVALDTRQCTSPSRWTRQDDLRRSTTLITEASAIGDVGFLRARDTGGGTHWYVMADITNGDPDAEDILFVPWALSMLYSAGGTNFERPRGADMLPFNSPTIGSLCTPGLCAMHHSTREAELGLSTDFVFVLVAAACEREDAYGLYDVCFARQRVDAVGRMLDTYRLLGSTAPFVSVRAPAIAPMSAMDAPGMRRDAVRLFAVGHEESGRQVVLVGTVELDDPDDGMLYPNLVEGFQELFSADELGPIARKGIRSLTVLPEPVPDDSDAVAYRLWFVTETPGEATISHAVVTFPSGGGLPHVRLYGANPILRAGAGALALCAETPGETCKIRGVSVTHDDDRFRMVVSYDEPGQDPESSRLVTLLQPLRGGLP